MNSLTIPRLVSRYSPLAASRRWISRSRLPGRTPSICDIVPGKEDKFGTRQKEFRNNLEAARKKKADQESQSTSVPPASSSFASVSRTAPLKRSNVRNSSPTVPDAAASLDSVSLSSLSTHRAVGGKVEGETGSVGKRHVLSNLIYGTTANQQHEQELERSYSEVLARGKYIHSIVFHTVKSNRIDEYIDLVGEWYPRMATTENYHVHLVGSWRTEVGDCETFIHIWEYEGYSGYHRSLHEISCHPDYPEFDRKLADLITSKHTSLMQEFSFWPTSPPRRLGGVFELRSYTLHPGNLLEWEVQWQRGLDVRREVMEGVGAWFVQIGELNTVHYLWQYADLEERKSQREKSWSIEGWAETVHKTVPLIQTMKSRILVPLPWSPVS